MRISIFVVYIGGLGVKQIYILNENCDLSINCQYQRIFKVNS